MLICELLGQTWHRLALNSPKPNPALRPLTLVPNEAVSIQIAKQKVAAFEAEIARRKVRTMIGGGASVCFRIRTG